ncbi:MAG: hypothetical protein BWY86_00760 [Candidatus Aminicenantes bacterium ADurb.Bin508]|nr:MAG: hypothetical protein BWY86_00760 [Candidatus Aminicenantes bacterium ADurb.Bin508]
MERAAPTRPYRGMSQRFRRTFRTIVPTVFIRLIVGLSMRMKSSETPKVVLITTEREIHPRTAAPGTKRGPKRPMIVREIRMKIPRSPRSRRRIHRVTFRYWVLRLLRSPVCWATEITGIKMGSKLWRTFFRTKEASSARP